MRPQDGRGPRRDLGEGFPKPASGRGQGGASAGGALVGGVSGGSGDAGGPGVGEGAARARLDFVKVALAE